MEFYMNIMNILYPLGVTVILLIIFYIFYRTR